MTKKDTPRYNGAIMPAPESTDGELRVVCPPGSAISEIYNAFRKRGYDVKLK